MAGATLGHPGGATLAGATLAGATLAGATLAGATLAEATLVGANLGDNPGGGNPGPSNPGGGKVRCKPNGRRSRKVHDSGEANSRYNCPATLSPWRGNFIEKDDEASPAREEDEAGRAVAEKVHNS